MSGHNLFQSYRFGESQDLILAARSGNLQAFNRLILEYQDPIYSLVSYLCGDARSSERITQLVFQRVLKELPGCSLEDFYVWIFQVALKVCQKQLNRNNLWSFNRHNHNHPTNETLIRKDLVQAQNHKPKFIPENDAAYLQQRLVNLPYRYREVIVLIDIGAMDYASTARILNISEMDVRQRLTKARQQLAFADSVHL